MKKSELLKLIPTHKIKLYVCTSSDDGDYYDCTKKSLLKVLNNYEDDDFIKVTVHEKNLLIG